MQFFGGQNPLGGQNFADILGGAPTSSFHTGRVPFALLTCLAGFAFTLAFTFLLVTLCAEGRWRARWRPAGQPFWRLWQRRR